MYKVVQKHKYLSTSKLFLGTVLDKMYSVSFHQQHLKQLHNHTVPFCLWVCVLPSSTGFSFCQWPFWKAVTACSLIKSPSIYGPHVSKTSRNLNGFTILEPEFKKTHHVDGKCSLVFTTESGELYNLDQRSDRKNSKELDMQNTVIINLLLIRLFCLSEVIRAEMSCHMGFCSRFLGLKVSSDRRKTAAHDVITQVNDTDQ